MWDRPSSLSFLRAVGQAFQGASYRFIGIDALLQAKRAAGRPKDLEVVAELESILEERAD